MAKRKQTPRRGLAIVVANSEYKKKNKPLKCPANDKANVIDAFKKLGIKTIGLSNLTAYELYLSLRCIGDSDADPGFLLFYYSGHGSREFTRTYGEFEFKKKKSVKKEESDKTEGNKKKPKLEDREAVALPALNECVIGIQDNHLETMKIVDVLQNCFPDIPKAFIFDTCRGIIEGDRKVNIVKQSEVMLKNSDWKRTPGGILQTFHLRNSIVVNSTSHGMISYEGFKKMSWYTESFVRHLKTSNELQTVLRNVQKEFFEKEIKMSPQFIDSTIEPFLLY